MTYEFTIRFDLITAAIVIVYFAIGAALFWAMVWFHRENHQGWTIGDPRPVWTFLAAFAWPLTIPLATFAFVGKSAMEVKTRLDNEKTWVEFKEFMRERERKGGRA